MIKPIPRRFLENVHTNKESDLYTCFNYLLEYLATVKQLVAAFNLWARERKSGSLRADPPLPPPSAVIGRKIHQEQRINIFCDIAEY